jgi:hypothetical protein
MVHESWLKMSFLFFLYMNGCRKSSRWHGDGNWLAFNDRGAGRGPAEKHYAPWVKARQGKWKQTFNVLGSTNRLKPPRRIGYKGEFLTPR